jgi:PAS domain S-box-containing protein
MIAESVLDLRRGIDGGEIIPYFQPLVELRTGQLSGFEVLARWKHPLRGLVQPDEFIALAEEGGFIGELMNGLLVQAFRAAAKLPAYLRLSVNVSAIQLRDLKLQRQISLAAEMAGFALKRLTVEITESALVGNLEHAREITEELRSMGARIAIDDFGTGYSSLRHLHALPFDEIKVDQTFVQTMLSRRESRKIVGAIIGLGQSLGLTTVAEGVEDKEQAEMLLWLGCDIGQGWLYGRPLAASELQAYVTAHKKGGRKDAAKPPSSKDQAFHMEALPSQRLAQLQAIYDGAPVGLCFLDRNLRYVSLNKRLAAMNNVPIVAHLGRPMKEVIPQFYEQLSHYLDRALAGEVFRGLKTRGTMEDGSVQMRSTSYQPTLDEAGEVVGISVAVVDITERETKEEALRESEDHYRYTLDANPQVTWVADPTGMITEASASWTKLTGLTQEESIEWGWARVVHPEDLASVSDVWKRSLETGEALDVEYRVKCVDGGWRWVRSRATARRGPEGEIMRWYGALEDIDDYKRLVFELKATKEKLRALRDATGVGESAGEEANEEPGQELGRAGC